MSKSITVEARADRSRTFVAQLFAITMFVGALLVFWIQPMFGKMVLPLLGGAPNVWITAMLFFQTMLLAGYGYAHLVARFVPRRWQLVVHLSVLGLGFASLPVGVAHIGAFRDIPIAWLSAVMGVSIGVPFFAVSATAPLVQRWFASSGHPDAADPYFLYAASNIGSILVLLGYPVFLEPFLRLGEQSWAWAAGYAFLTVLIVACGLHVRRDEASREVAPAAEPVRRFAAVTARQRFLWVALAFAPSSLLLGVTTQITTDVAAAPLLWVVPLALYLLTYVVTFARRPLLRHHWMVIAQPYLLVAALFLLLPQGVWLRFLVLLAVFFVTAMVCHGELVRRRPAASHLTEFYLWMSFGGMLGGVFNAIVAPLVFNGVYEFGIALCVACMLRPGPAGGSRMPRVLDYLVPALLLFLVALPPKLLGVSLRDLHVPTLFVAFILATVIVFGSKRRPIRFGLGMGVLLLGTMTAGPDVHVIERHRNFFGVYKILSRQDGRMHVLEHGTTFHGAELTNPEMWREQLLYYTGDGPVGQVFAKLDRASPRRNIGLVGLGVGSMLCYGRPGQNWTIYEIDPMVERIARDTRYFRYLSACADGIEVRTVHGDARLALEKAGTGLFDLLVLDAFSSDAIPVHLLTREALAVYRAKLTPGGLILFHISNRHLDLNPVLARLVADAGMVGLVQRHQPPNPADRFRAPSVWAVIGRSEADLALFSDDSRWRRLQAPDRAAVWTDDFSNVLSVFDWHVQFRSLSELWRDLVH